MPSSPQVKRVILFGYGRMGTYHARAALSILSDKRDLLVVDPSRDSRRAASMQEISSVSSIEPEDIPPDAALIIAAPTNAHIPLIARFGHAGRSILVEKPCALTIDQFRELRGFSHELSNRVSVGFWRRYCDPFIALKDHIIRGDIGPVRALLSCQWDASPPSLSLAPPNSTGGIALDCGVHETDMLNWLGLGPMRISSILHPSQQSERVAVDDHDQLLVAGLTALEIPAQIILSRTCGGVDEIFWKVIGNKGSLELRVGDSATLTHLRSDGTIVTTSYPDSTFEEALRRQLLASVSRDPDAAGIEDAISAATPWLRI